MFKTTQDPSLNQVTQTMLRKLTHSSGYTQEKLNVQKYLSHPQILTFIIRATTNLSLSIQRGTGANKSNKLKYVSLSALEAADPDLSGLESSKVGQILQTLFVSTGCDYISFFSGIGKATFLRYSFQHAAFITGANAEGSLADTHLDTNNFQKGFLAFLRLVGTV